MLGVRGASSAGLGEPPGDGSRQSAFEIEMSVVCCYFLLDIVGRNKLYEKTIYSSILQAHRSLHTKQVLAAPIASG